MYFRFLKYLAVLFAIMIVRARACVSECVCFCVCVVVSVCMRVFARVRLLCASAWRVRCWRSRVSWSPTCARPCVYPAQVVAVPVFIICGTGTRMTQADIDPLIPANQIKSNQAQFLVHE